MVLLMMSILAQALGTQRSSILNSRPPWPIGSGYLTSLDLIKRGLGVMGRKRWGRKYYGWGWGTIPDLPVMTPISLRSWWCGVVEVGYRQASFSSTFNARGLEMLEGAGRVSSYPSGMSTSAPGSRLCINRQCSRFVLGFFRGWNTNPTQLWTLSSSTNTGGYHDIQVTNTFAQRL